MIPYLCIQFTLYQWLPVYSSHRGYLQSLSFKPSSIEMSTKACLNGPTELSTMVSRSTNHYFLCSCCFISEYYKEQYLLLLNSTVTVLWSKAILCSTQCNANWSIFQRWFFCVRAFSHKFLKTWIHLWWLTRSCHWRQLCNFLDRLLYCHKPQSKLCWISEQTVFHMQFLQIICTFQFYQRSLWMKI